MEVCGAKFVFESAEINFSLCLTQNYSIFQTKDTQGCLQQVGHFYSEL